MTFRTILLIPLMTCLLACGIFTQGEDGPSPAVAHASIPLSPFVGEATLEEKILGSTTIVRARMTSFSSGVVVVTDVTQGGTDNRYSPVFRFNLAVSEYLKGTGPSSIVAVWFDGHSYASSDEANDALDIVLEERDAQWDNREAVIFLYNGSTEFGTALDAEFEPTDHFLLSLGDRYSSDDSYSLHSESNKIWLPSISTATSTGDGQKYLLDVPPTSETVTLGDLKDLIGDVAAELDTGDDSEEFIDCVWAKYRHLRNQRNFPEAKGRPYGVWKLDYTVESGQPAGTTLDRREINGSFATITLTGEDSDFFSFATSTATEDINGDGALGIFQNVQFARPVPAGEYTFDMEEAGEGFSLCNFVISNTWTVTVNAADDTLHELYFDPVAVGSTVAADSSNGVLKPASFTGANGAATTINSLAWEPASTSSATTDGQVKLLIDDDPDEVMGEHILDFIALDGSVSLLLDMFDATVESRPASGTGTQTHRLTWSLSSQPWTAGDRLMVRIREAPLSPPASRVVAEVLTSPTPVPLATQAMPVECPVTPVAVTAQDKPIQSPTPTPLAAPPPRAIWAGDSSIGLKTVESDTVVKATMSSLLSEVALVSDYLHGGAYRCSPVLKFSIDVSEYLLGTGSTSSVAIWVNGRTYETKAEADDRLAEILAERDSQWDSREAIIFLLSDTNHDFGAELEALLERDDYFVLTKSDPFYSDDDGYSLHSVTSRLWLPAVSTTTTAGDSQQFLLDVPPTTKTITLGELRQQVSEVAAEIAAGDGSTSYNSCLYQKHIFLTNQQNWPEERGEIYILWETDHDVDSGSPAVLAKRQIESSYPDSGFRADRRVENRDSALFTYEHGAVTNLFDRVTYEVMVKLARPLIAGEYSFDLKEFTAFYNQCNFVISNPWTVTVTAPDGTLHEFFFDPVTVGSAFGADPTNGVLRPVSFTGADGATSTISSLAWEPSATSSGSASGSVMVEVVASDLNAALDEHVLDFIELDGTVSLSLDVFDATVESESASGTGTQTHTLTWPLSSQPWTAGDKLMVRIREAPP